MIMQKRKFLTQFLVLVLVGVVAISGCNKEKVEEDYSI